jgi:prophage regulatory protein
MFNDAQGGLNMVRMIARLPAVLNSDPRSRSALYRDMEEGFFPKPVLIGARAVGWPTNEVDAMVAARISGKSENEIRALVKTLEAARKGQL